MRWLMLAVCGCIAVMMAGCTDVEHLLSHETESVDPDVVDEWETKPITITGVIRYDSEWHTVPNDDFPEILSGWTVVVETDEGEMFSCDLLPKYTERSWEIDKTHVTVTGWTFVVGSPNQLFDGDLQYL